MTSTVLRLTVVMLLAVSASPVFAAREQHTFEVSVSLPSPTFYVLPMDPQFLEREQQMAWNPVNEALEPLRTHFDVLSDSGEILARLGDLPLLSNGHNLVLLNVTFNGQQLNLQSQTVINKQQAEAGSHVPLVIAAVKPLGGFQPGDYYGTVHLLFDVLTP